MNYKKPMIPFWNTNFTKDEIEAISEAIRSRNISQGNITLLLEKELEKLLGIKAAIMCTSGSMSLTLALMALEIGHGDEVIIPDRTWIATAHAVMQCGATPVIVDVETDRPIIDDKKIEQAISDETKAIIPVHLNGRSANMEEIMRIAKKANIYVVEDAAQALFSMHKEKYLGTYGDIGCFSLSMAKLLSSGQGGFLITNNTELAEKIRRMRIHGLDSVFNPEQWTMMGGNFRYTDIQASLILSQLKRLDKKMQTCQAIYRTYESGLRETDSGNIIPVDIENGELPIYGEFLSNDRQYLYKYLAEKGIEARPFYPSISTAKYICESSKRCGPFKNSYLYQEKGIYLPAGTDSCKEEITKVVNTIKQLDINKNKAG